MGRQRGEDEGDVWLPVHPVGKPRSSGVPLAQEDQSPTGRNPVWRASATRSGTLISVLGAVAVTLFFLGDTLSWFGSGENLGRVQLAPYQVEALDGLVEVERHGTSLRVERFDAEVGDRLVCDSETRAVVRVAGAGMLRLEPETDLRLEVASDSGWRVYLEYGQVTASMSAAPRLFQMRTPSGVIVDLGCVFTATVGAGSGTLLLVRSGDAVFEAGERQVFVPQGAQVMAWPGRGPGTPVWEDSSGPLRMAVSSLDALAHAAPVDLEQSGADGALEELGRLSESRDSLMLWHLLSHPHPQVSHAAFNYLNALAPPSSKVDSEKVRLGDPAASGMWLEELRESW
jgi:hypothetical protein